MLDGASLEWNMQISLYGGTTRNAGAKLDVGWASTNSGG